LRATIAILLLAGAGACTDFENPTTVIDLRMLAVVAAPSEIILEADISNPAMPTVDPANNPPVTLTALVADPVGYGRELSYTIRACPNDPFAAAPPMGGQGGGVFPSGGARTTVGSALCDDADPNTWWLTSGIIPAGDGDRVSVQASAPLQPTTDQLIAAFRADIFPDQFGNLHGGFDLGMPFTFDITIDAGTEQIRGIKRVLYWARRINDAQAANQNPTIDTLSAFYDRDEATFEPADEVKVIPPVDAMNPTFLVMPGKRSIWIMPSAGNTETFQTTVIDPDTHLAVPFTVERETLRYRFFATAGTFAPANTTSERNPALGGDAPLRLESEYTLPTADKIATRPDGTAIVTIWVVVRDDRGGESWQERKLLITP
jgi:hypothetical protein